MMILKRRFGAPVVGPVADADTLLGATVVAVAAGVAGAAETVALETVGVGFTRRVFRLRYSDSRPNTNHSLFFNTDS